MKQLIILFSILSLFTFSTFFAQLIVKDQEATPNTLMQFNDEGSSGSITLPPLSSIGTSTSKLYNLGGNLYWGSSQLGLAGSAGGWTDDGSIVRLSTSSDKVGIRTSAPASYLSVGGIGNSYAIISAIAAHYQIGVYVSASGTAATGIYAESSSGNAIEGIATGNSNGGYFLAQGTNGRGVHGEANGEDSYAAYFDGRGYFSGNVGIGVTSPGQKLTLPSDSFIGWEHTASNQSVTYKIGHDAVTAGPMQFVTSFNPGATRPVFSFFASSSEICTMLRNGNIGIGTDTPNSKLSIVGLSEYSDNAAAIIAGLEEGDLYRTGDILKIVH